MIGTGNVLNDEINDFEAGIDDSCAHRRDRLATLNSLQEGIERKVFKGDVVQGPLEDSVRDCQGRVEDADVIRL